MASVCGGKSLVISCNNHLYFGVVRELTFVSQIFSFTGSTSSWMWFFQRMINFLGQPGGYVQDSSLTQNGMWYASLMSWRYTSNQHSLLPLENHIDWRHRFCDCAGVGFCSQFLTRYSFMSPASMMAIKKRGGVSNECHPELPHKSFPW